MSKLRAIWLLICAKKYIMHVHPQDLIRYSPNYTTHDLADTIKVLNNVANTIVVQEDLVNAFSEN